jgi:hypothetical protein
VKHHGARIGVGHRDSRFAFLADDAAVGGVLRGQLHILVIVVVEPSPFRLIKAVGNGVTVRCRPAPFPS